MSVTLSQTGIPAQIVITPGPGVAFAGQGEDGVGIAGASSDGNGHLQILLTNATTIDAGKVGRTVASVAAAGINAATATPITANVALVLAGVAGGGVALQPGLNQSVAVVNKLAFALPVYPPANAAINQLAAGVAFSVPAGTSVVFHSPDGLAWATQ